MKLNFKNNKGYTLIELLVGFVVGTIMAAAIYYSYGIFSNSYQSIVEKTSVNRALRSAMSDITQNIRKAGYVDPNRVCNITNNCSSFSIGSSTSINNRDWKYLDPVSGTIIHGSPLIYFYGVPFTASAIDALAIMFDDDPNNVRYLSYHPYMNNNIRYLAKTEYKCPNWAGGGCTNLDNDPMFPYLEMMKFSFYGKDGSRLNPSATYRGNAFFTYWTGAITQSINPLDVSIIFRSRNEIYQTNQTKSFIIDGLTYTYTDKYYREIAMGSVYPRNIIKTK
jgi:prepilin-type N-terminal cleavage/methylation domain-containing protein